MRTFPTIALAVTITVVQASPRAQTPALKTVMEEKVQNAQALLRPVVLGDFIAIDRYAARLGKLTYTEVASWQSNPDAEYQRQAAAFLDAIEALGLAADARDAARSSAAYGKLVASCTGCHALRKGARSVELTAPPAVLDPNAVRNGP